MAFNLCQIAAKAVGIGLSSKLLPKVVQSTNASRFIHLTAYLSAEPLKKKRRVDPAVVRAREERRKKKVEKQIRRLEKVQKQLKPIDELEPAFSLLDQKERRMRKPCMSQERKEEIILLKKEWTRHCTKQFQADVDMFARIAQSQQRALDELRSESEELYQAAVKIDSTLLPFSFNGPTDTPPIENYASPDGAYIDISKKWQ